MIASQSAVSLPYCQPFDGSLLSKLNYCLVANGQAATLSLLLKEIFDLLHALLAHNCTCCGEVSKSQVIWAGCHVCAQLCLLGLDAEMN